MHNLVHIFVTRSTAEAGDGSRIAPDVPLRASFYYNTCIVNLVKQCMRSYEASLRKDKGSEYADECLAKGLSMVTRIEGSFCRLLGKILCLGDSISVYSLKVKPDTGCNDPRARNPDFVMHVVMYCDLNFNSAAFKRFIAHCRELAFCKKSPGIYKDLVVQIPDEVLGRKSKGAV